MLCPKLINVRTALVELGRKQPNSWEWQDRRSKEYWEWWGTEGEMRHLHSFHTPRYEAASKHEGEQFNGLSKKNK